MSVCVGTLPQFMGECVCLHICVIHPGVYQCDSVCVCVCVCVCVHDF